jgi:murein DD-endopeptidase MepM/ murein hydrolase activator NlpD
MKTCYHAGMAINAAARAWILVAFCLLAAAGCVPAPAPAASPTALLDPAPTNTPVLPSTPTFTPAAAQVLQSPSPTPQAYTPLCSPLEGEPLADLGRPDLLKNPFQAPRLGDDGGHHGVDFAYWTRSDGSSMLGLPILAAVDGVVSTVISDRFPYGNALIIETPIENLSPDWRSQLPFDAYDADAPLNVPISLTCPTYADRPASQSLSLYTLYAHMQNEPDVQVGEQVTCGEEIGQVGTTGKSVNFHLHFETRIGSSGAAFSSLTHYDTSATQEEMRDYCLWRLSGAFQPFDPMLLLNMTSSPE